jgi:hypothetical protein
MLNPSPSEKPQPSVPEGLYDTESGLPANAEKPQQGTPRTDAVCDTPIMGTACTPHKWDKLQEHARQLELELSQACLERDSARNVLARAIERERLANMRADQAEEARDASQSATPAREADELLRRAMTHCHGNALRMREQFKAENGDQLYAEAMQVAVDIQAYFRRADKTASDKGQG